MSEPIRVPDVPAPAGVCYRQNTTGIRHALVRCGYPAGHPGPCSWAVAVFVLELSARGLVVLTRGDDLVPPLLVPLELRARRPELGTLVGGTSLGDVFRALEDLQHELRQGDPTWTAPQSET